MQRKRSILSLLLAMQRPFLGPSSFFLGTIPSLTMKLTKVGTSTFLPLLSTVHIEFLLQLQVARQIHHARAGPLGVDMFLFNFPHLRPPPNLCRLPLLHQDHGVRIVRHLIRLCRPLVQITSKLSLIYPLLRGSPLGYLSSHEAGCLVLILDPLLPSGLLRSKEPPRCQLRWMRT